MELGFHPGAGDDAMISAETRSGRVAAYRSATKPPYEIPQIAARSSCALEDVVQLLEITVELAVRIHADAGAEVPLQRIADRPAALLERFESRTDPFPTPLDARDHDQRRPGTREEETHRHVLNTHL